MHLKLFNPLPIRLWIKKTGPLEFNFIKIAMTGMIQLNKNTIVTLESIMSDILLKRIKNLFVSI